MIEVKGLNMVDNQYGSELKFIPKPNGRLFICAQNDRELLTLI